MLRTFFASAMLLASTSPLTLVEQDQFPSQIANSEPYLPILAAQTSASSETSALATTEAEGLRAAMIKLRRSNKAY